MQWSGLYTALITPFKEELVDEEGFEKLLQRQLEALVDGVVLFGSTGESTTLTLKEKEQLLKKAKSCFKPKIIVGVGSPSTATTIDNALWAEEQGADALLVVAPYYNKPTQEGIYCHFEKLSLHTKLPFFVYNIPSRTGVNIEVETMKKLAQLPRFVGLKESPAHFSQVLDITNTPLSYSLLAGDDLLTLPMMALGAQGVISVVSNLYPKKMKQLVDAALKQDFLNARLHHLELYPVMKALICETNPIPIKAALTYCNLPAGPPRLPLTPLSLKNTEALVSVLTNSHFT